MGLAVNILDYECYMMKRVDREGAFKPIPPGHCWTGLHTAAVEIISESDDIERKCSCGGKMAVGFTVCHRRGQGWKHKAAFLFVPTSLRCQGLVVLSLEWPFLVHLPFFFLFVCPSPPSHLCLLSSHFLRVLDLAGYCAAVQGAEMLLATGWMAETCSEKSETGS